MKTKHKLLDVTVFFMSALLLMATPTLAATIDIANDSLTHFASFTNDLPAGALSTISSASPATVYGDFGWHNSPSGGNDYAGILLNDMYSVIGLRFQVHTNPLKGFTLQGSTDTTSGFDGTWTDLFSSTVTERIEFAWQEWSFTNSEAYSAYRIYISDDYAAGWAMYRWDLLVNTVPEPATALLLGLGLVGLAGMRRKIRK